MSIAYKFEKAGRVAPVKYTEIVYAFLFDALVMRVHIYYTDIIGAFLIMGSLLLVSYLKMTGKIR